MTRNIVVLTGGGSAGHIPPNLPLAEELRARHWEIIYIGSRAGIEREITKAWPVKYVAVTTGKFRRYLSPLNFIDFFCFLWGIVESTLLLHRISPSIVFSKGGFVSLPVVIGAWLNGIPIIIHES